MTLLECINGRKIHLFRSGFHAIVGVIKKLEERIPIERHKQHSPTQPPPKELKVP